MSGVLQVTGAAVSYGVLATFVRLAYDEGYSPAEVTFSQYFLGVLAFGLSKIPISFSRKRLEKPMLKSRLKLLGGGSFFGLTGLFYYFSVQYLPVSISVVLLMQSIWMGMLAESLCTRRLPSRRKATAGLVILAGTVLATNALVALNELNLTGVLWGLSAALTYAVSMLVANRVETQVESGKRSFYMLVGAFVVVSLISLPSLLSRFNISILWTWGLLLAFFGTIVPPVLFNKGLPKTGIGLGAILISIEIPVSVGMAFMVLDEKIFPGQWVGMLLILAGVVLINYGLLRKGDIKSRLLPKRSR